MDRGVFWKSLLDRVVTSTETKLKPLLAEVFNYSQDSLLAAMKSLVFGSSNNK